MIQGMKRFDARGAVVAALKELDLFIETKDNAMVIPICAYVLISAAVTNDQHARFIVNQRMSLSLSSSLSGGLTAKV
jgi:hypothetical protein